MISKQQVFVETSVQITRVFGAQDERGLIETLLQQPQYDFVTSHYVYMEYQRAVIADFAHVHRSFRQAQTMGEAMRLIFSSSRSFRPRSLIRCGRIAALAYGEQEVVSLDEATVVLELYLHRLLPRIFWHYVQPIHDDISCDLVRIGTQYTPDLTFTVADRCRKETAGCSLPHFLQHNRDRLQRLAGFLADNPHVVKEQSRLEQALAAVEHDPRNALGQATCWPLGDIVIALQVPEHAALWTHDADFDTLCSALGIARFDPAAG